LVFAERQPLSAPTWLKPSVIVLALAGALPFSPAGLPGSVPAAPLPLLQAVLTIITIASAMVSPHFFLLCIM
jgi:hypothetical protein